MQLTTEVTWNATVLAYAVTAAISDVAWGKIPRVFTVVALLAGLVFHWFAGSMVSAAVAAVIGFGVGITLFRLGAIGGGDVKLVTALGALLGLSRWLLAMQVAIVVAGVIALIQILRRKAVRQTLHNMGEIVRGVVVTGLDGHPVINVRNKALVRTPFGLAAALGTLVAVVLRT